MAYDMPPSTGAHATPAGNNWTKPDSTYRVRPHQTVGLDGCQLLFPVAKWVGVYRSVQRPYPIAPQAAVFEYLGKWNERMFFIRDHNHVVVVFDGRVNPSSAVSEHRMTSRRQQLQNRRCKTPSMHKLMTRSTATTARRTGRMRHLCVARYDNLLITTFKAWVAARGCVVLGGCVIGGTVLCGGRVLRCDARRSVADLPKTCAPCVCVAASKTLSRWSSRPLSRPPAREPTTRGCHRHNSL